MKTRIITILWFLWFVAICSYSNAQVYCEPYGDPMNELPWFSDLANSVQGNSCKQCLIEQYCGSTGEIYFVTVPSGTCSDSTFDVYDESGNLFCFNGGITGGNCPTGFELFYIDTPFECTQDPINVSFAPTEAYAGPFTYYMNGNVEGGTEPYSYEWTGPFGVMTSTFGNPIFAMPGEGVYEICLTVTDALGETDTYCTIVITPNPPCHSSLLENPSGICTTLYNPVCGCDGNTYSNPCEAEKAGLTAWTPGACEPSCVSITNPVSELPWFSDLADQVQNSPCLCAIEQYCHVSGEIYFFTPLDLTSSCADFPQNFYDINGNVFCSDGGFTGGDCPSGFFGELSYINTPFQCSPQCDFYIAPAFICEGENAVLTASGNPGLNFTWECGGIIQNGQTITLPTSSWSPGTYTCVVTASDGICQSSETVTITINPEVQFFVNPVNICEEENAVLTVTGSPGLNFTWDCGGIIQNGSTITLPTSSWSPGNYTCVVTASDGICQSSETVTIDIEPAIEIIVESQQACEGIFSVTLNVLNPDPSIQYHWEGTNVASPNSPETIIFTESLPPQTYQYTVTADNGVCSTQETVLLTILDSSSPECGPPSCVAITDPMTELPWFSDLANQIQSDPCLCAIEQYCHTSGEIYFFAPLAPGAPCADYQEIVYDVNGNVVCFSGGITGGTCPLDLFSQLEYINTPFECSNEQLSVTLNPTEAYAGPFTYFMNGLVEDGTGPYEYTWTAPFGTINTTYANPIFAMPGEGVFEVCLTVTDANGLTGTACAIIVTANPPCHSPLLEKPDLICTTVLDPVCGCDGNTYGNDCEADRAGLTSWTPGPCPVDNLSISIAPTFAGVGPTEYFMNGTVSGGTGPYVYEWTGPFGTATSTTPNPIYSMQEEGVYEVCVTVTDANGFTDSDCAIIITPNPPCHSPLLEKPGAFCITLYDPVCGCDGVTYGNSCEAEKAGLTSYTPGPCMTSCNIPEDVSVDPLSDTEAEVSWTGSPSATKYLVKYKYRISPGVWSSWENISTTTNYLLLENLIPAKVYKVRVKALCPSGWTDLSSTVQWFQSGCPTVAPSEITLTQNPAGYAYEYQLNWPDVPGAIKYKILYRKVGTSTWTTATRVASQMGLSAPAIEHFETYEFKIRAQCTSGYWGPFSNPNTIIYIEYIDPNSLRTAELIPAKLYPNPTSGNISIDFDLDEKVEPNYIIQDILGRTVLQGDMNKIQKGFNSININTSELKDGHYIISARTDTKILFTEKFVKVSQ